ncbi:MAG: DNA replication/repair protein RecF [Opitutales bacterium]|nr:DNA replication/repair protein RecF [Opitutales bacterium]
MFIKSLRLANFRNAELSQADFSGGRVWICGENAQGKTNLLEAAGLLHAARSFRSSKLAPLIRSGAQKAQILARVEGENRAESEILIEISPSKRAVFVNGQEKKTLAEFIGKFPAMAISNADIKLVRGAPAERRKFADILISSVSPEYLAALRGYHAALAQRNSLLKSENADGALFDAFEFEMAKHAETINRTRAEFFDIIGEIAAQKYCALSGGRECAAIKLKPNFPQKNAAEYAAAWKIERPKDRIFKTTLSGAHKDDFSIRISNRDAREFASEGQQRSIALSLKLAEFEIFKGRLSSIPVLLCDDILGELDSLRRAAFWECVDKNAQIIASSTTPPDAGASSSGKWQIISARAGSYFAQ